VRVVFTIPRNRPEFLVWPFRFDCTAPLISKIVQDIFQSALRLCASTLRNIKGTTIVTFLMVFLIQNTQNRDARAINLKLNELIRAIDKARDQIIDIENLSDLELDELQARHYKLQSRSARF
jgi:hypothetical protein